MTKANIDQAEITKFSSHAATWWNPEGDLRTLHQLNPIRLDYINEKAPLKGKQVIDIGCGGGILTEGMAKLGAEVTGIDMSEPALIVAKLHQHESKVKIDYIHTTAEKIASERPAQYDVVTCLEMLEHVPDPVSIVQACSQLVKPGGQVFLSTLNRNVKSYLQAIIGAEYILKLLPRNTHDYAKFIRPSELAEWGRKCGLTVKDVTGIHYDLWSKIFSLTSDVSVNYLISLERTTFTPSSLIS
jgi:2-polyprenyl-6-hydroxyphenyl methylase/3-demethylubiquinone-9 3-methyltransferase